VIASEDASDALAIAICHATHEATSRRLAREVR
jgi:Holliday junction resolvasome RuvABC endonuclease subunit